MPYHVLKKKYSYSGKLAVAERERERESKTSENKIIHGDNLLALKSLLPQYEGRIKCIYIDPPYNTGNENWVYTVTCSALQSILMINPSCLLIRRIPR